MTPPSPRPPRIWTVTIDLNRRSARIATIALVIVIGVVALVLRSREGGTDGDSRGGAADALPSVVAFAPADRFAQDLVLVDVESGDTVPLTAAADGVIDYAVSPSGNQIAYAQNNADGTADLWLVDLTYGAEQATTRRLTHCVEARCRNPAWSPDERHIAYQREDFLPAPDRGLGAPRVWIVTIATVQTDLLIADPQVLGADPAWSPDGRHIAVYDPARSGISIYALARTTPTLVTRIAGIPEAAGVWSPDGSKLLYPILVRSTGSIEFNTHLEITNVVEDTRIEITGPYDAPIEEGSATWSPEGTHLIIARRYMDARYTAGKQIVRVDWRTRTPQTLVADAQYTHAAPQYDPTGRWILYQRYDLATIDAQPEIWVYDTATDSAQQVLANAFLPAWGP